MNFIEEKIIDEVADQIGASPDNLLVEVENFKEEQPFMAGYFFSDAFDGFTQNEKEYALFLGLVIWKSIKVEHPELPAVDEEQYQAAEEHTLEVLQGISARKFRERLDVFFNQTDQEDLLAFIEDSLMTDEDDVVTQEGRELLFVILKSMMDCLMENIEEY